MDVLAHRHNGETSGRIHLNGRILTPDVFRMKFGYVIQSDSLTCMPNLTTFETLYYIAQLKFRAESEIKDNHIYQKVKTHSSYLRFKSNISSGKTTICILNLKLMFL